MEQAVVQRWKRPVKFIVHGEDVTRKRWDPSRGGWMEVPSVTVEPEDFARIRLGYVCAQPGCFEPHETPFPEQCAVCGFRMRDYQMQVVEDEYDGERWVGTKIDIEQELDRVDEQHYRNFYWSKNHHILVPRSIPEGA